MLVTTALALDLCVFGLIRNTRAEQAEDVTLRSVITHVRRVSPGSGTGPSLLPELELWGPLEEAQISFCFIQDALKSIKNRFLLRNSYMQLSLEFTCSLGRFWVGFSSPVRINLHMARVLNRTMIPQDSPALKGVF